MDCKSLNRIIIKEIEALSKLLSLLSEQHELLLKDDLLGLEDIVKRIELCNKEIAEAEVERRKIANGNSMNNIVTELNDEELSNNYRIIKRLIGSVNVQKETNDMILKIGLGFSSRMLNILNPSRSNKTYNSLGKLKR